MKEKAMKPMRVWAVECRDGKSCHDVGWARQDARRLCAEADVNLGSVKCGPHRIVAATMLVPDRP